MYLLVFLPTIQREEYVMCRYNKKLMIILPIILCFIFASATASILAGSNYPLEPGEVLIDERVIDETHVEIFTMIDQQVYLKKLEKSESGWYVTDAEPISQKWTGLVTENVRMKSSKGLPDMVEAELRQYGLDPLSLPPSVDYSGSELIPPVGEQHENSCVGWSVGYYLRSFQQAKDFMWDVKQNDIIIRDHVFSPSFIYNQLNNGIDNGCSLASAAQLLLETGAATMSDFPYIPGDYFTRPSADVIASAYPHRVREWRRLFSKHDTPDNEIIQRIREYLNTGDLVVAGGYIGYGFSYPRKDMNGVSIITVESYAPFKHAYVVVGYDDNFITPDGAGAFIILSSWGKDWGDQGFCRISYKAFTANIIEGFVFTDLINNVQGRINVSVNDSVSFKTELSGYCTFDYSILDENGELIYEQNGLTGNAGTNIFDWDGNDIHGRKAADGQYTMQLITYNKGRKGMPVTYTFTKTGKIESVSCNANVIDCYIQSVDIPISFRSDGILDISIAYNGALYGFISGERVKAGESKLYTIDPTVFDFNNKDLDKITIVIDIK
jgi:C1A family cysteine protease